MLLDKTYALCYTDYRSVAQGVVFREGQAKMTDDQKQDRFLADWLGEDYRFRDVYDLRRFAYGRISFLEAQVKRLQTVARGAVNYCKGYWDWELLYDLCDALPEADLGENEEGEQ